MVSTIKNCSVEIDAADDTDLDGRSVRAIKEEFLHSNLEKQIQGKNSRLLSSCRPTITSPPSYSYQWLMKKEVDVYDDALVGCQVWLPNPTLAIPTTTVKMSCHQLPKYVSPSLYARNDSWPYIFPFEYTFDTLICSLYCCLVLDLPMAYIMFYPPWVRSTTT